MSPNFYLTTESDPVPIGAVYVTTEDAPQKLEIGVIREGYSSIGDMLGQDVFYIAHRGGSENWDEMTLRAYTNAAVWGAGALEVSLARTSDDVYFGLHDEYMDRTSLGNPAGTTLNPKTMTWAQVQEYDVFGREPYMRLEEIAEAYGDSHVFFLDPKYIDRSTSVSRQHFLNKIKELFPDWQERVIIKLYWNFNSDWGAEAKAAGFTTWGYLWHDDGFSQVTGNPANHSNLDILGFNYNASSGDWTTLSSLGKMIIGHICPDEEAANLALGKGAVGIMASGVKQIIPNRSAFIH